MILKFLAFWFIEMKGAISLVFFPFCVLTLPSDGTDSDKTIVFITAKVRTDLMTKVGKKKALYAEHW